MKNVRYILSAHYSIDEARIYRLDGYANINYKIELENGATYVLKEHGHEPGIEDLLITEGELLSRLSNQMNDKVPQPVLSKQGDYLVRDGHIPNLSYRMLKWVEGDIFCEAKQSLELHYSLGAFIAEMDKVLADEYYASISARRTDWDLQYLPSLFPRIKLVKDIHIRKKVHYFMLQFNEHVIPALPGLRRSIIHNDANDWNLFVKGNEVAGIIDFGDVVEGPLIQELAIFLAYALFDKEEPIEWATSAVRGYHKILELTALEIDLLYYYIAGRLCQSLINSAYSKSENPDNDYLSVSEQQAIALLDRWLKINPDGFADQLRIACGIDPLAQAPLEESLNRRFAHISRAQSLSYTHPIKMKRAAFQYMYDAYGNTFLDAYNNIPHVGHMHPKVVEAGQKQMARLNTNTRYLFDELAAYSEKLIRKFPSPLNKVFFVNSGSAASDLAIRMAQTHTGSRNVMVLEHGYHGHTRIGIDISHYKFGRKGGWGQADYILKAPIPDTYRGEFAQNNGTAGMAYARQAMEQVYNSNTGLAAFIAEPVVGCAGQVPLAKGYLQHLYPLIRKQGGVCISDEVQTGFGRMGSTFWGFELQDVVPDIVVLGKPMGNGHPMAAVVTTDEVASSFDNGMEFFSSFGGNPVSCAIGMAVLDVIDEEGLQQHAYHTGNHFMKLLEELKQEFECVGDVRGSGLFLGVEFVSDPESKNHHPELAGLIKNELRNNGLLVSTDGPFDNIIKMKPPLCFNTYNAERVVEEMFRILKSNL